MACFYPTAIIAMVLELYYQVKLAVSATEYAHHALAVARTPGGPVGSPYGRPRPALTADPPTPTPSAARCRTTPVDPLELAFASTQLALLVVLVALVYVSRLPPAPERKGYQRVSINDDPEPAAAVGEAGKKSGTKPTDAAAGANKVDISPWKGLRPKLEKVCARSTSAGHAVAVRDADRDNSRQPGPVGVRGWASSQLLPFLWPAKSQRLRIHVVVSFILLLSVRVLNIYVPIYQKIVVDDLAVWSWGAEDAGR